MHENRETSEMPATKVSRRTAGEGSGHTARVYVPEESHSGVVPMNHSNKDGTSLAESEEGTYLVAAASGTVSLLPVRRAHRASGRLRRSRSRLLRRAAGWIGRVLRVQWDELYVRLLDPKTGQLLREHVRQKRG